VEVRRDGIGADAADDGFTVFFHGGYPRISDGLRLLARLGTRREPMVRSRRAAHARLGTVRLEVSVGWL
jgi:hypothetical protein